MTHHAWLAIFDRHAWFQSIIEEQAARLPEDYETSSDVQLQRHVAKLSWRSHRHKERIMRHWLRGIDLADDCTRQ